MSACTAGDTMLWVVSLARSRGGQLFPRVLHQGASCQHLLVPKHMRGPTIVNRARHQMGASRSRRSLLWLGGGAALAAATATVDAAASPPQAHASAAASPAVYYLVTDY